MDKSELRHAGNRIEVSRHSTAKLNKMKTDKYKDRIKSEVVEVDENIKMEGPDEIATDMAKINFDKKGNTEVCHVWAKEFWGRLSDNNVTSAFTKLHNKKVSERSH